MPLLFNSKCCMRFDRLRIHAFFALLALTGTSGFAEPLAPVPDAFYAEVGLGEDVSSGTIGVTWDLAWHHENSFGNWEAYLDASLGHWRLSDSAAVGKHRSATRLGFTPVLRLRPRSWGRFFVEAGIGANWIFPIYQNDDRRFSTTFNFGDHVAAGWRFGASGEQELTLRLQHFSNAGIKHPNPGENFVQLRYLRRF